MRKYIVLLFIITVSTLHGQTIQYLENNPEWRIFRTMGPCIEHGEYNYFIYGDTLIGGKIYKNVFSKGYMQGLGGPDPWCPSYYSSYIDTVPSHFLRQENKKLFSIDPGWPNEILLYNFGLNQNDSFKVFWSYDTTYFMTVHIDSIDSILIDTDYRRVFHLSDADCGMGGPTTTIIEGIGTLNDLFQFCNGEFDGRFLECFGVNGASLYSPNSDSCNLDIVVTGLNNDLLSMDDLYIFPNPVHDKLTIANSNGHKIICQIELVNSYGQRLLTKKDSNALDISNLTNGVYFIKITFNNSSIVTKKVIKN